MIGRWTPESGIRNFECVWVCVCICVCVYMYICISEFPDVYVFLPLGVWVCRNECLFTISNLKHFFLSHFSTSPGLQTNTISERGFKTVSTTTWNCPLRIDKIIYGISDIRCALLCVSRDNCLMYSTNKARCILTNTGVDSPENFVNYTKWYVQYWTVSAIVYASHIFLVLH